MFYLHTYTQGKLRWFDSVIPVLRHDNCVCIKKVKVDNDQEMSEKAKSTGSKRLVCLMLEFPSAR